MSALRPACLLLLLAAPLRAADAPEPTWIDAAARPGYRAAEKVVDGVYGLVRGGLIGTFLPGRLGRESSVALNEDSYAAFSAELAARQARAARRDWETRPAEGALGGASFNSWLSGSVAAHRDAVTDAFAATLMARYRVKRLGRASGDMLRDPAQWDADLLASAVLFGGVYGYFAGLRTDVDAGPLRVGLDLAPGERLRAGAGGRLARVALSRRGSPLSVYGEWSRSASADRVGANWSSRF